MAEGTIDTLVIEVSGNADNAHKGIDKLVASLAKLERSIDGPAGKLGRLNEYVRKLSNSVSGLNVQKLLQLNTLSVSKTLGNNVAHIASAIEAIPEEAAAKVDALTGLSVLSGLSVSKTIPNNLTQLAGAISQLPSDTRDKVSGLAPLSAISGVDVPANAGPNLAAIAKAVRDLPEDAMTKLLGIAEALRGFASLQGVSITTFVNSIKRLPEAMREFAKLDVDAFADQMDKLNQRLAPLATNVQKLSNAINSLPKSMRTAGNAAKSVTSANRYMAQQMEEAGKKADRLSDRLKRLFNAAKLIAGVRFIVSKIAECTNAVSDYIEDMNLYAASMGEFAEEGTKFAKSVQTLMGIDSGEWMRFQGVLMSIGTGFGIANDRMATMSQNMTQLGYDISSFYNLDIDEAMRKVQSGFAGELEPMRRIGYDLSVARMEIERTNLGIEKQVSDMSQAEKAVLRYYLMMTQLTQVHGDMARTINSPANQLRVLRAQLIMAARAIGNVFIPMLNLILPYAIAAAKAVQILAGSIARLLGMNTTFEVDYSTLDMSGVNTGVDDLANSLGDVQTGAEDAEEAVKELKNTVLGFDELNKLQDATSGGKSGKDGKDDIDVGSIIDQIPLETYDFLEGLNDHIGKITDELRDKLLELLPIIAAIAAGLLAWKIADALLPDTLTGIDRFKKLLGIAMAVAGAILLIHGAWDAWINGLNMGNLLEMLGGAALLISGLGLAFGKVGAGIGAIISGLVIYATSLKDALTNGLNEINLFGMAAGTGLAVLGSIFAGLPPVVTGLIATIGGGIMSVISFMDAWQNGLGIENIKGYIGGAALAIAGLYAAFGPIGAAIGGVIAGIGAVVLGLHDMWENGFSPTNFAMTELGFVGIGTAIGSLFGPIGALVGAIIGAVAGVIATMIADWEGFTTWLSGLWETATGAIVEWWGGVSEWFSVNVAQPVVEVFNGMGQFINEAWTNICNIFTFAGELIRLAMEVIINIITLPWQFLWENFGGPAQTAWNAVSTFVSGKATALASFLQGKWQTIKSNASAAWGAVQT
ncbi:MAG: hypothetical protein J6D54_03925, partial [Olsenella sp.]|nr:hypothetical protein [Olsenella sp.]